MGQAQGPTPEAAHYASYLVRLWRDETEPAHHIWQGEVQHIQSGEYWRFDSMADLLHFLSSRTDSDEKAQPAAPDV